MNATAQTAASEAASAPAPAQAPAEDTSKVKKTAKKATVRKGKYGDEDIIKVLKAENPKRAGTAAHKKYELLKKHDGKTIKEFKQQIKKDPKLRGRQSLDWDIKHKFIEVQKAK